MNKEDIVSSEAGIGFFGTSYMIKYSLTEFTITVEKEFYNTLTKKELTTNFISVGQEHRNLLHKRLDEFINLALKKASEK